jgi:hypothetical protein
MSRAFWHSSLGFAVGGLACLAIFVAARVIAGCNSVLGIERATLEADAGGDAAGTVEGAASLTCSNYCAVMMQNCTGEYLEYLSNDVCMTMCMYLPIGQYYSLDDEPDNVDTLGCRLWHAHSAALHPEVHCRHAGPLGADLCGGPCGPFCSLDWNYCTDDNDIPVYDGQVTGCEGVCESDGGLPYVEADSGDMVGPSGAMIETGDTLNCRLWHLETAISLDMPETHCPHTAEQSATCR